MQLIVQEIPKKVAYEWIENKHYAKRKCSISFVYGLFIKNKLVGVCTFGYPPNYNYNNGKCVFKTKSVLTLELNRLIVEDGLPKNTLSRFLSKAMSLLPQPNCIVSYADQNQGHTGFIYQATNWLYTGESTPKHRYHFADGYTFDIRRGIDNKIAEHGEVIRKEKLMPTQRYLFINSSKKHKNALIKDLKMGIKKYPKADNRRYDTSYECKPYFID